MSPLVLEAPIVRVTLLEDRARVVRRGVVQLTAGAAQLIIEPVAPALVDKSLVVRVGGSGGVTVVDSRVKRRLVAEAEAAGEKGTYEALTVELRERRQKEALLGAEAELVVAEADGLSRLASWTLSDLSDDVGRGRGLDSATLSKLQDVAEKERALRQKAARLWHELGQFTRETERLDARLQLERNPATTRWCQIVVDVVGDRTTEAVFELEYVVPGAMWRPAHSATLAEDGEGGVTATVATSGCVWQNTGEPWTNVELVFSTERASLGAEPPTLTTDLLSVRKRQEQLVVETRDHEVHSLSGRDESVAIATDLPGIDDGGQIVALHSAQRTSVPSDGRPHRIPLTSFSTDAEVDLWAYPELSNTVIYQTVVGNKSEAPLLAGPMELVRAGGWVGRTSIGFVAPGEEFEISWGPEPTLRVKREVINLKEESRALSSWSSRERRVLVRVSNLGVSARRLSLRERIPVSEIEKVKIECEAANNSDNVKPDDEGFVTWIIDLAGGAHRKLELRYTTKRHDDVVGL